MAELGTARRNRGLYPVLIVSIGLHAAAAVVAGVWIVSKYFAPPQAAFVAPPAKAIVIPADEREHRINMAAFDGLAAKPSYTDKIASTRPAAFALPELPRVPLDQMLPLDPSEILADQVTSLVGSAGLGSGMGAGLAGAGGIGQGKGMSFFGIESQGRRILLLFDVSTSVVNKAVRAGVPLTKIKEETLELIGGLPINAKFGLIQFSQNYKPFGTELFAANDANKEAARTWVENEWVESGTMSASKKVVSNPDGFVGVLQRGLQMDPDVIFVVSDGDFQWRRGGGNRDIDLEEVEQLLETQEKAGKKASVNFIGFEMKSEDKSNLSRIARRTGGTLKEIKN